MRVNELSVAVRPGDLLGLLGVLKQGVIENVLVTVSLGLLDAEVQERLLALRAAFTFELEVEGVGKADGRVALPLEQSFAGGKHAGVHWDPSLGHGDHSPDEVGVVVDRVDR